MTFVGKILVILIMAFSLVFLGVATVVFSTATNWKDKSAAQKTELGKLQTKNSDLDARVKDAQSKLDTAKAEHAKVIADRENRIRDLDKKAKDADDQATAARGQLELAQKNAQVALAEATARKTETDVLNGTLNQAQDQATLFNRQNLELTDRIRILERQKTTAEQNAKDLRNSNAKLMAFVRGKGLNPGNLDNLDPNSVPPQVEGRVKEVDAKNSSVEITIGSNDGLTIGQEFFLFRLQPGPKFLGKVKIVATYPQKSVADVIGTTVNRLRIQEGDIVSSSFNAQ